MLQVYLIRHAETKWNILQRIQGHSDSELTETGKRQAMQVANRVKKLGITHIISSDLGRARQTTEIISKICNFNQIIFDARLRELDMGVLEERDIDSLTKEEEFWRQQLILGVDGWFIPGGESIKTMAERMNEALNSCLQFSKGSLPILVSHGIAMSCLINIVLGLPTYAERRLRLRNCSISCLRYQKSKWLAPGWIIESLGDISHLDEY